MNKLLKILLIVGISLLLVGGVIFLAAFGAAGWDITFLSGVVLEEKRFDERAENPVDDVTIEFSNAAIEVRVENTNALCVEYPLSKNKNGQELNTVTVTETEGSLSIVERQNLHFNLFSWDLTAPKIVLHLPATRTYDLSLTTDNGKISFTGDKLNATALVLSTDNGEIETLPTEIVCQEAFFCETNNGALRLGSITAAMLTAQTDNGTIDLENCSVTGRAFVETNNGKITLCGNIWANELTVETDNGEIQASAAVIYANTIKLSSNIGDIHARIAGKQTDYTVTVEHDLGNTNVHSATGGDKTLSVSLDIGNIQIDFTE